MSDSEMLYTTACQAPLSKGFSRKEYWSGLPHPPPGDLPDPGIELVSLALAGGLFIAIVIWEPQTLIYIYNNFILIDAKNLYLSRIETEYFIGINSE